MTAPISPSPPVPPVSAIEPSLLEQLVQKISHMLQALFAALACLLQPLCPAAQPSVPLAAPSAFAAQDLTTFYYGLSRNASGVTLDEILAWDDRRLEAQHDFIQWLFPLRTRSQFNPTAPVLDEPTRVIMAQDPLIQQNILRSFDRMLQFYGFERRPDGSIAPAPNHASRRAEWATPSNHNYLRITRILTNLNLMNYTVEARQFFAALDPIPEIDAGTKRIWRNAAFPSQ